MSSVGILAIGLYLPCEIRTNDWWTGEQVAAWAKDVRPAPPPPPSTLSPNAARIVKAISAQRHDPFQGTRKRHVAANDETSCDLEAAAAHDALARGGVSATNIDLLLTNTSAPELLLTNSAAKLHARLGLRPECFALQVEASSYSFLAQLELAGAMIGAGRARYALLVQSSMATRLVESTSAQAPLFGDGATAVLVGPVQTAGVRASIHFADGRYADSLVAGVPGHTWYAPGRSIIHLANPVAMREILLQTIDLCEVSVSAVLKRAGARPEDVDFFCIHQGTAWLRTLAQEQCGMTHARSIESFAETGYIFGAIMPYALRMAEDQNLLASGDQVMLFGGGTGMTYGATLLRWGPS